MIVLYCIIVQKSPIFVQLSPIQCTYSNIFIRFFKFFSANTNIYQNSYRVIGALCGLRQGVLSSQCGHLISFGTKYFMSLRGIANGDAVAIPRKGNLVINQKIKLYFCDAFLVLNLMIYMIPKKYHSRSYIWQECPFDSSLKHVILCALCPFPAIATSLCSSQ